jgi:hypothetical protein
MVRNLKLTIISEKEYRFCSSVVNSGTNMNRLHKTHWQHKNKIGIRLRRAGKVPRTLSTTKRLFKLIEY